MGLKRVYFEFYWRRGCTGKKVMKGRCVVKYQMLPRWRNGIRSGLKNLWEKSREGSIPSLGTLLIPQKGSRIRK